MLAHLLFLRVNGGMSNATALADTFGTESFVAAALVTQVPAEFLQDMQEDYVRDRQLQPGVYHTAMSTKWLQLAGYAERQDTTLLEPVH